MNVQSLPEAEAEALEQILPTLDLSNATMKSVRAQLEAAVGHPCKQYNKQLKERLVSFITETTSASKGQGRERGATSDSEGSGEEPHRTKRRRRSKSGPALLEELNEEAVKLKHFSDKLPPGIEKWDLYVQAALKFLEVACLEPSKEKMLDTMSSTAELLEFVASKAERGADEGHKSRHIAVMAYQLAAIARHRVVWSRTHRLNTTNERLAEEASLEALPEESSFKGERGRDRLELHRNVKTLFKAMHSWKLGQALRGKDLRSENVGRRSYRRMVVLPTLDLMQSDMKAAVKQVRLALEQAKAEP